MTSSSPDDAATRGPRRASSAPVAAMLAVSEALRVILERIAHASGWLLLVLMTTTCLGVLGRKLGVPLPFTMFAEMEWHLHTAIFSFWMGHNYVINAHPRVDSYTGGLSGRQRLWLELAGCLLFALPYMAMVSWFGWDLVRNAFVNGESSDAPLGLPYRWIVKGALFAGFVLVLAGIVSVLLKVVAALVERREPDEVGLSLRATTPEV